MKCNSCHKEVDENEYRCFGEHEPGKKVYCNNCWEELQDWLKRKHREEKVPHNNLKLGFLKVLFCRCYC